MNNDHGFKKLSFITMRWIVTIKELFKLGFIFLSEMTPTQFPLRLLFLLSGLALLAFGVVLAIRSNLGASPISSVPYVYSFIVPPFCRNTNHHDAYIDDCGADDHSGFSISMASMVTAACWHRIWFSDKCHPWLNAFLVIWSLHHSIIVVLIELPDHGFWSVSGSKRI